MVIIKIRDGVKQHFDVRLAEWGCALILLNWGVALLAPGDTFALSAAYQGLARIWSETTWGYACLLIGGARVIALTLNGTFAHTRYGRLSPHVRAVFSLLSCFFWFQIVFGFLITPGGLKPPISTGPGTYFIIMLMDVWNSRRALSDAGEADSALRHGGS
jgi:hypothetical protein